jgi:dTDP-4-dehydrorhamnose 3,5-epimerase
MKVTEIEGVAGPLLIQPTRHFDERGWFEESWSIAHGPHVFVQENVSFSERVGTLRGLHFQRPPFSQAKLVSVDKGAILDFLLDLRRPTRGQAAVVNLNQASGLLFVPDGFAHGFLTLEAATQVRYRVSAPYAPDQEGGVSCRDPAIASLLPAGMSDLILSPRDLEWPMLSDLGAVFE